MENQTGKERRKYKRYKAKDTALVFCKNFPGQILDISQGGLSFKYSEFEASDLDCEHIDILVPEENFFAKDIECRQVSDRPIDHMNPYSTIMVKRMGMKFSECKALQNLGLDSLIEAVSA